MPRLTPNNRKAVGSRLNGGRSFSWFLAGCSSSPSASSYGAARPGRNALSAPRSSKSNWRNAGSGLGSGAIRSVSSRARRRITERGISKAHAVQPATGGHLLRARTRIAERGLRCKSPLRDGPPSLAERGRQMVIHMTRARSVLRAGANARNLDLCILALKAARNTANLNMARKLKKKTSSALRLPTRTEHPQPEHPHPKHPHPDEIVSTGDSRVTRANRSDTMRIS